MTAETTRVNGAVSAKEQAFLPGFPVFIDELAGTLAVQSQYVLHGNLRDDFIVEPPGADPQPAALMPLLWEALRRRGYECFICYDPVDGITVYPPTPDAQNAAQRLLGPRAIGRRPSLERLRAHVAKVVGAREQPPLEADAAAQGASQPQGSAARPAPEAVPQHSATAPPVRAAFVIDYAARITRVPGQLDPAERDFFLYCLKLALTARPFVCGNAPNALYNPIVWLVEGERDLPPWLTAGVDPIRTIAVGKPTLGEREKLARFLLPMLPPVETSDPQAATKATTEFARRTDGMTLRSMIEVARLSKDRGISADRVADAVRIYKLGVIKNPWRHESVRRQIIDGEKTIGDRVMGQRMAIGKTLDILKRAALGLSGAQATSTVSRPRGVLFFAGPTGVGKTELAKQIAELLFGDVNAYLRFDMSEFAADHAVDRLIGAPPGYVGFEAGGELTGAVRRNPFQVVLFDEIEKASKGVMDKFLQILEDGRLTDGQGITTHFSECVLVFTSNLGIWRTDKKTGEREQLVFPTASYPEIEKKVRAEVERHFVYELERPELLNRLGDNIVVFDFIRKPVREMICAQQLDNIVAAVRREQQISLEFTGEARAQLIDTCTGDEEKGGRGVGNLLESNLINPLARILFERDAQAGMTARVTSARRGTEERGPEIEADLIGAGRR